MAFWCEWGNREEDGCNRGNDRRACAGRGCLAGRSFRELWVRHLVHAALTIFLSSAATTDNRLNVVVSYRKDSGSSINARFGYSYSGTNHWAGYFNQSSGTKRATWTNAYVQSTCKSAVGMMQVTGQQTFQTPPVTGC